eukprot:scaffold1424_cov168-Amphora_coffeaeformis.AAC.10
MPPTNPPPRAVKIGGAPMALNRCLVKVDPSMNTAPTRAPSTIRVDDPLHKDRMPPSAIMLRAAVGMFSFVVVTRVLIFSKTVPPARSDEIRKMAPRARVDNKLGGVVGGAETSWTTCCSCCACSVRRVGRVVAWETKRELVLPRPTVPADKK